VGNRSKYRKLPDLYVKGAELVLEDGLVMWLQALNPFEVEEARKDAQVARARFGLAMKTIGSPEYDQLHASVLLRGETATIDDIIDARGADFFLKATQEIQVDPEWKERVEIMERSDAGDLSEDDPERALLNQINKDWLAEVQRRQVEDKDLLREQLERMSAEELMDEYSKEWIDRRGNVFALQAYIMTEVFYGARVCDAVPDDMGYFGTGSHASCNHRERVFESRDDVRELPTDLYEALREKFDSIAMSIRDAKNSPRPLSSSESSQRPSQAGESTPSTEEASSTVPGT